MKNFLTCLFYSLFSILPAMESLDSLFKLGIENYSKGNYKKAIVNFSDCAEIAARQHDLSALSKAYNNLANAYSQIGKTDQGLDYYFKALKIAEQNNDRAGVAKSTKNIGALFSEQKDFSNALNYFKEAFAIGQNLKDSSIIADCLNNEGVVFEQQNDYQNALSVYQQALAIYRAQHDEERIALALNNLGIVYKHLGNYPLSINSYDAALKISERLGNRFMMAATLNNMGNVYALQKNYFKAIEFCKGALDTAQKINASEIIIEAYGGIADAYESVKNYPEAIRYRKRYEEEKDHFINLERSNQLADMQAKYETEKKDLEIRQLSLEQHNQELALQKKNLQMVLISVILFLLVTSGIIYLNYLKTWQQKVLAQAKVETEYRERQRIARDMHDELGSGMTRISVTAELARKHIQGNVELKNNLQTISKASHEVAENMNDLIWSLMPENASLDSLLAKVREFSGNFFEDTDVNCELNIPDEIEALSVSKEAHRDIFLSVKEALNNCVKHSGCTSVRLTIHFGGNALNIQVQDNGNGFDPDESPVHRNGLRNMRQRIERSGGTFQLTSSPGSGTKIEINIPLEKMII